MRLVLLSFLCTLTLSGNVLDHPAGRLVNDPEVLVLLSDLMRLGGYGFRETESAAFIVVEKGGRYRCITWPFHADPQRQQYRGTIPEFTVAIAHTHPRNLRMPSARDQFTARTTGLPVVVVTPHHIYVATPEGGTVAVINEQVPWMRGDASSLGICRAPADVARARTRN